MWRKQRKLKLQKQYVKGPGGMPGANGIKNSDGTRWLRGRKMGPAGARHVTPWHFRKMPLCLSAHQVTTQRRSRPCVCPPLRSTRSASLVGTGSHSLVLCSLAGKEECSTGSARNAFVRAASTCLLHASWHGGGIAAGECGQPAVAGVTTAPAFLENCLTVSVTPGWQSMLRKNTQI